MCENQRFYPRGTFVSQALLVAQILLKKPGKHLHMRTLDPKCLENTVWSFIYC